MKQYLDPLVDMPCILEGPLDNLFELATTNFYLIGSRAQAFPLQDG
jgi:hypothetical protein